MKTDVNSGQSESTATARPSPMTLRAVLAKLTAVYSNEDKQRLLARLAQPTQPTIVSFLNKHAFNLCCQDEEFHRSLLASEYVLRDGIGMAVGLLALGFRPGFNLNGTDLIPQIARLYANRRVMLLGTVSPYVERAGEAFGAFGCRIVHVQDGYADDKAYVEAVATHRPELVILGMGMPKQERVAMLMSQELDFPVLIINGGAILDFQAGRFIRAPKLWRVLHMEWLFRLLQEPRRLWQRYIIGGLLFVSRILRLRLQGVTHATINAAETGR